MNAWCLHSDAAEVWSFEAMNKKLGQAGDTVLADFNDATKVMCALAVTGGLLLLPICRVMFRALASANLSCD